MAYFTPCIDETGLHIPTYNEIKSELIEQAKAIYGQDIYLENDSQDYQFISIMADKIHDSFLTAQLAYNNRSPTTAIGAALDGLVKLNGIKRKSATASTCKVEIKAEPRTQIINGMIADNLGNNWKLPSLISIPDGNKSMTLEVLATCTILGKVTAPPNTLTNIVTPTSGWISVTNNVAATIGQEVEGQEQLRARQAISTAKPSKTILEGTIGGIAEIPDVTRYRVYENDTNMVDENTIPSHSICAVVEGGKDYEIAQEIYLRKTPGCGTYGDVIVEIDIGTIYGLPKVSPIKFFRPSYYDIHVSISIKRLSGFVSQTTKTIQENIVSYLNSLQIGEDLTLSALWAIALSAMPNLTMPQFSITSVLAGIDGNMNSEDIEISFNCVSRGHLDHIEILFV